MLVLVLVLVLGVAACGLQLAVCGLRCAACGLRYVHDVIYLSMKKTPRVHEDQQGHMLLLA